MVLDALYIKANPIAKLPLQNPIPHGLHGNWAEAYAGPEQSTIMSNLVPRSTLELAHGSNKWLMNALNGHPVLNYYGNPMSLQMASYCTALSGAFHSSKCSKAHHFSPGLR